jgi:hypothetical protein
MLYMVTFTINIPPMLAYIPYMIYMDPMGMGCPYLGMQWVSKWDCPRGFGGCNLHPIMGATFYSQGISVVLSYLLSWQCLTLHTLGVLSFWPLAASYVTFTPTFPSPWDTKTWEMRGQTIQLPNINFCKKKHMVLSSATKWISQNRGQTPAAQPWNF